MIETLFALSLLCSTPVSDDGPPHVHHEDCGPHEVIEWAAQRGGALVGRSDTTITVERGLTLVLQGLDGDIQVGTWPRQQLRVEAEHGRRDRLVLRREGRRLHVEAVRPNSIAAHVEWKLTVPEWLPLQISCLGGDVTVEGTQGRLEVSALSGDVKVQGARGPLSLNSVEGQVQVLDTEGTIRASSINNDVRLTRIVGEVDAQSVNGSIRMEYLRALHVVASSVNGRVWFVGPLQPQGRYNLSSHNGEMLIGLPDGQDAQMRVTTHQGEVQSDLPGWTVPSPSTSRSFTFKLGAGGSEVDLESFNGLIQLLQLKDVELKLQRVDERIRERVRQRSAPRAPRVPRPAGTPPPAPEAPKEDR